LTDKPTSLGLPPVEIYRNDTTSTIVKSNLTHWQILKKYILINPSIWFVSIAAAFIYFIRFVITDWGITFMVDNGIKCDVAGRLLVFTPLFGIFGGISAGWISGKFFKNRYIPISLIYLFCSIFCIFGLYHSTNQHMSYWIIVIFFALIGIFIDGPQTIACGVLVTRITVQESIGTAIGIVGIFEYIGVFISGIGAAWIIEKFNWAWLFTICAILSLLAMFLIALIYKKELLQIKS
ncbi:MAG: MFS transporter, partial [Endomicrobium sp.]|nr:MFS transporter [Endomicrobium sp.]